MCIWARQNESGERVAETTCRTNFCRLPRRWFIHPLPSCKHHVPRSISKTRKNFVETKSKHTVWIIVKTAAVSCLPTSPKLTNLNTLLIVIVSRRALHQRTIIKTFQRPPRNKTKICLHRFLPNFPRGFNWFHSEINRSKRDYRWCVECVKSLLHDRRSTYFSFKLFNLFPIK